jgi:hypothetical protein
MRSVRSSFPWQYLIFSTVPNTEILLKSWKYWMNSQRSLCFFGDFNEMLGIDFDVKLWRSSSSDWLWSSRWSNEAGNFCRFTKIEDKAVFLTVWYSYVEDRAETKQFEDPPDYSDKTISGIFGNCETIRSTLTHEARWGSFRVRREFSLHIFSWFLERFTSLKTINTVMIRR